MCLYKCVNAFLLSAFVCVHTSVCMCVCEVCVGTHKDWKKISEPQGLELQEDVTQWEPNSKGNILIDEWCGSATLRLGVLGCKKKKKQAQ